MKALTLKYQIFRLKTFVWENMTQRKGNKAKKNQNPLHYIINRTLGPGWCGSMD